MWSSDDGNGITQKFLQKGANDEEEEDGLRPRGMSYTNPQLCLQVANLSYDSAEIGTDYIMGTANEKKLHNVSFSAHSGKVTAIISSKVWEQECLIDLLACRKKIGSFDGEIFLTGCHDKQFSKNFAFVPHKTIYIPGLTFYDTLMYSAKLRLAGRSDVDIVKRVQDVMKIMQIWTSKFRVIPEHPESKGDDGLKLRLLSIAIEILTLPPLILISDPTLNLDASKAQQILESLQALAKMGHIVVCTLPKPNAVLAEYYDNILVLSRGYSIYCAPLSKAEEYFTSKMMSYSIRKDEKGNAEVSPFEFILSIASGEERPNNARVPEHPIILQEKFEASEFYTKIKVVGEEEKCTLYTKDVLEYFGYRVINDNTISVALSRFMTVCKRSMYSKIRDKDPLKRSLASSIMLSIVIGYLQQNQGGRSGSQHPQSGYYLQTIFSFPYPFTSNLTATCFFVLIFAFVVQVLNVHTLTQKFEVFRYEQSANCCSSVGFATATIASEVPFAFIYAWIFSTIIYFWVDFAKGAYNYAFFCGVISGTAIVGLFTCMFFTSLFKKEMVIRNVYFLVIFFGLLLSGFPFQLGFLHGGNASKVQNYMVELSKLNPLRWSFEALMNWKFTRGYIDPQLYLNTFSFNGYDHDHIFATLGNFIVFSGLCFFLLLFPSPMLMKRKESRLAHANRASSSASRDSDSGKGDSFDETSVGIPAPAVSKRASETPKPVIYSREGSLMGKSRLSTTISQTGVDNDTQGPTVSFKDLTYRVRDPRSPLGYQTVINNASGQFDRGNLSLIIGSNSSGKTSLLHALAGDVGPLSDFLGDVNYNRSPINKSKPLWQRCALVDAHDELYRDLTVKQAIEFAMKLRCWNLNGFSVIDENVRATMSLLHLDDIQHKKVKRCTLGERRRVSIAEEIVAGPKLVLIDEPTLELDIYEEAVLMSTLRELVNQDRTVIASMQQPTANVFKLFDIVLLLSQGRVIYHGAVSNAHTYFISSPYAFNFTKYQSSPSDFLIAISSGSIKDSQGNIVLPDILDNYYRQTNLSVNLQKRLDKYITKSNGDIKINNAVANPLAKDDGSKGVNRTDTDTSLELDRKESFAGGISTGYKGSGIFALQFLKIVFCTTNPLSTCFSMTEFKMLLLKMYIILHRESVNLIQRWELCLGALIIHIILAAIFGWIVGDTTCTSCVYNATSFFAVGVLILLLASIQFIYYLYRYQCVSLKEQSRGLYTNFEQWAVAGIPLYILRCICSMVFSAIVYKMLHFDDTNELFGYFIASNMCAVLAISILSEVVVSYVPNQRAAYFMLPGTIFFQFTFSGLFIKAQSLPNWLAPWVTSVSIIRWVFQGNWINQFNGDTRLIVIPQVNFNAYTSFLSLFGWGGKTKETCLYNLFYFMFVFKIMSYLTGAFATILHRCGRRYKEAIPG